MLEAAELLILILALIALGLTFYLRKDLEEHNLQMWVYAAIPLLTITVIDLAFWHELPQDVAELFSYVFGALTMVAFFLGVLMAFWRR